MTRILALIATLFALPAYAIDIEEITSDGGITAWFVEEHSIPIVSIDILFRGGGSIDAADKQGATNLMMGLLEEGAGDMDATQFQEAAETLAVRFSFNAGRDSVSIGATVLRENLDASMELLGLAINEPNFDDIAFARVKGQVESILRSDTTNPRSISGDRLFADAFAGHPYGRTLEGTPETVAALTQQDMRDAHAAALVKSRVSIGVVGDITPEELSPLIDALLGALPQIGPELPAMTDTIAAAGTTVIDFPSPQSTAIMAHTSILRDDPDYIAAYVMNHILGTGFISRLNQEVREKRGLTYGVSSFLVPFQSAALHMASVSAENDKIAGAVEVIRTEWAKMATDGVTAEELDAAQKYLTGSYPLRFDSNGAIASALAGLQFGNLPIDYINTRNDQVNAITVEDINRVAARLLKPESLQVIIVGQPTGLPAD